MLLVFGRLSADNELVALRCNGVSIGRICVSLAVIAVVCTGVCLWLNVFVAPAAQQALKATIVDMATRDPMALFGSDQVIDQFPGRKIYVGKKDGNKLENIIVFETNSASMPIRVTFARSGTLEADLENQRILMHLYGARYQQRDEKDPYDLNRIRDGINMAEGTLPISLEELYQQEKRRPSRSAMSLEQLLEQLKSADQREQSASRTEIEQTPRVPVFLPRLCAHRGPARRHRAPPRNLDGLSHQHRGRVRVFPFHHHGRHVALQSERAPGVAGLAAERAFSRARRLDVSAARAALNQGADFPVAKAGR